MPFNEMAKSRPGLSCATTLTRCPPGDRYGGFRRTAPVLYERTEDEMLGHRHGSLDGCRDQKSSKPTPCNPGHISVSGHTGAVHSWFVISMRVLQNCT